MNGSSTFLLSYTRNSSCRFLNNSIRSFSSSLTVSRSVILSTELIPPSGSRGFLISGMIPSRSCPFFVIFYSSFCLLNRQIEVLRRGNTVLLQPANRFTSDIIFLLIIWIYYRQFNMVMLLNHSSTFLFSSSESGSSSSGGSLGFGSWNSSTSSASTPISSGPTGWKGNCEALRPYPI